jgi:hypothetical protein
VAGGRPWQDEQEVGLSTPGSRDCVQGVLEHFKHHGRSLG